MELQIGDRYENAAGRARLANKLRVRMRNPDWAAEAVPFARDEGSLPDAEREGLVTDYGRRAVALLKRAVAAGYADFAHLEPTLVPLRAVPELDAALDELARGGR